MLRQLDSVHMCTYNWSRYVLLNGYTPGVTRVTNRREVTNGRAGVASLLVNVEVADDAGEAYSVGTPREVG